MLLPTSAFYIVKRDKGVYLVKSKASGLWTLPGGNPAENQTYSEFARMCLCGYFEQAKVKSLALIVSPKDRVFIDEKVVSCSVFGCWMINPERPGMRGELWLAPGAALVPHILCPEIRCFMSLPKVQSFLQR